MIIFIIKYALLIAIMILCICVFKQKIESKIIEPFFNYRYFDYFRYPRIRKKVLDNHSDKLSDFSSNEIYIIKTSLGKINYDKTMYIFIPFLLAIPLLWSLIINIPTFIVFLFISLIVSLIYLSNSFFKKYIRDVETNDEKLIEIYYVNLKIEQWIDSLYNYVFTYGLLVLLLFLNLLATTNPENEVFFQYCKKNYIQIDEESYNKTNYNFFSIFTVQISDHTSKDYLGIFNMFICTDNYFISKCLSYYYKYEEITTKAEEIRRKYGMK